MTDDYSSNSFGDPEGCYRRGYDQCAAFLLERVTPLLDAGAVMKLQAWKNEVEHWRGRWNANERGVSPPYPPKLGEG